MVSESRQHAWRIGFFRCLFSSTSYSLRPLSGFLRRDGRLCVPLPVCIALFLPLIVVCGKDSPTQSQHTVPVPVMVTPESADPASAGELVADPMRRALVALYEATGGENWKNSTNWLSDEPVHRWYGVTAAPAVRATGTSPRATEAGAALSLSGNDLSGTIPPELGNLVNLRELDLSDNGLSGTIPPELGNLVNLELLDLSGNMLSGVIPVELGSLRSLRTLRLQGNADLSGILPLSLSGMTSLQTLNLTGTGLCAPVDAAFQGWLEGVATRQGVETCGSATDRRVLITLYEATGGGTWTNNENWLSDASLDRWHGVTVDSSGRVDSLLLADNGLSGAIPSSLGELSALLSLDLSGNALSGVIPSSLGNLTELVLLDLSDNRLSGPIPAVLFTLANLETLDLSGNLFTLTASTDRDALAELYEGTDGPNWTNNENWLSDASLDRWHGVTVDSSGRVDSLRLADNDLSGAIPSSLGNLTALVSVDLSGNRLSGVIPSSLGNLTALSLLDLSDNRLLGPIPAVLFTLANLETLDLSGNLFNTSASTDRDALIALYEATDGPNWTNNENWLSDASLRSWTGVSTNDEGRVTGIHLGSNELSGPIPAALGQMTYLESLALHFNELTGSVPAELGALTHLTHLGLSGNQLTGPIPAELGGLTNLESLSLSENQLTGPIPTELGGLTELESLGLSDNQLTGSIPTELGQLTNLEGLSLFDNQLSGSIPTELGRLANLEGLGLSGNQLTGPIPVELGQLTNLEHLNLHDNQLSGSIPMELGGLTSLTYLDLSDNAELSGPLPSTLTGLHVLDSLFLDGTGLCVPPDAAFVAWLQGIQEKSGTANCTAGPPATPVPADLIGRWDYAGNNFEARLKQNLRAYLAAQGADQEEIAAEVDTWTVTLDYLDFHSDGVVYTRDDGELYDEPYTVTGNQIEFVDGGVLWTYSVTGDRLTLTFAIAVPDLLAALEEDPFLDESEIALFRAAYEGITSLIMYFDRYSGS